MNNLSFFQYQYIDNKASKTLVTLHGTGGTENDFLFLNDQLLSTYNILGMKGNTNENGATRFFRRKSATIFDQDNIKKEAIKLNEFIHEWMKKYKMNIDQFVFLGYSNGANMLLATMFYFPETIKNAVLLRPMLPFTPKEAVNLSETTILMNYAPNDELIPENDSIKLVVYLRKQQAHVTFQTYRSGHQLSAEEIADIIRFIQLT